MLTDNNTDIADKPLLSVVCVTYNHEKYIAQAIEGFLMQKTSFSFEIVLGEDCSSDRTREICREYQNKYPDKIRLIISNENIGPAFNFKRTIEAATGKYIAYCEGDDYWTDDDKLQKQVDFLEKNPDYFIASHNALVVYEGTDKPPIEWLGRRKKDTISLENLLSYGSSGASCSLVFRSSIVRELPDWYWKQKGGDWSLQILCADKGKMKYFSELMGVYRKHESNSSSNAIKKALEGNQPTFALPARYGLELSEAINKHFDYKYDTLIRRANIYWLLYYGKAYLSAGNMKSARQYALKIMKDMFALRFWSLYFRYPQAILLSATFIIPGFLGNFVGKIINNNK